MRILVTGQSGGIGRALRSELMQHNHWVPVMRRNAPYHAGHDVVADAVVCCAGTNEPADAIAVNLLWPMGLFAAHPEATYYVAFAGGGVGGAPGMDMSTQYVASKAALAVFVEQFALLHPDKHVFAVSPGRTDTKLNPSPTERGVHPAVPAAFVCRLLSGKYHHLSGSLLAAQRDDLDTMKPMRLRRVPL